MKWHKTIKETLYHFDAEIKNLLWISKTSVTISHQYINVQNPYVRAKHYN